MWAEERATREGRPRSLLQLLLPNFSRVWGRSPVRSTRSCHRVKTRLSDARTERSRLSLLKQTKRKALARGSWSKSLARCQGPRLFNKCNLTFKEIHVLFHWNAHSFFTYHNKDDGDISAIVNLSDTIVPYLRCTSRAAVLPPTMALDLDTSSPRKCITVPAVRRVAASRLRSSLNAQQKLTSAAKTMTAVAGDLPEWSKRKILTKWMSD